MAIIDNRSSGLLITVRAGDVLVGWAVQHCLRRRDVFRSALLRQAR
ncbi:hypothetical protein M3O57_10005 [Xanthomonas nasturtii]|uniref:Uncharacterized protein n=1 Tax=Xanthomonas nasturtii TaxID=1843581 RepID=A0ABT0LLI4_9XANT|nr:hypothetical protein [Xanthomonas nasturtii]MCL1499932.1 hypothetical protein [Xanthomonas nasturtii]MCL1503620.1 hypothetical protein [Xanthomonas nasturtii]MCL1523435.1 hypothetical protein [Xanthomonas nasturtii]MCL1529817.1 hypothetical protein [Xanthomonas nasturtii]MCL1550215.1 hypothetical protein [Xanthomonas nasturtii]